MKNDLLSTSDNFSLAIDKIIDDNKFKYDPSKELPFIDLSLITIPEPPEFDTQIDESAKEDIDSTELDDPSFMDQMLNMGKKLIRLQNDVLNLLNRNIDNLQKLDKLEINPKGILYPTNPIPIDTSQILGVEESKKFEYQPTTLKEIVMETILKESNNKIIYEPRYYYDNNSKLESRQQSIFLQNELIKEVISKEIKSEFTNVKDNNYAVFTNEINTIDNYFSSYSKILEKIIDSPNYKTSNFQNYIENINNTNKNSNSEYSSFDKIQSYDIIQSNYFTILEEIIKTNSRYDSIYNVEKIPNNFTSGSNQITNNQSYQNSTDNKSNLNFYENEIKAQNSNYISDYDYLSNLNNYYQRSLLQETILNQNPINTQSRFYDYDISNQIVSDYYQNLLNDSKQFFNPQNFSNDFKQFFNPQNFSEMKKIEFEVRNINNDTNELQNDFMYNNEINQQISRLENYLTKSVNYTDLNSFEDFSTLINKSISEENTINNLVEFLNNNKNINNSTLNKDYYALNQNNPLLENKMDLNIELQKLNSVNPNPNLQMMMSVLDNKQFSTLTDILEKNSKMFSDSFQNKKEQTPSQFSVMNMSVSKKQETDNNLSKELINVMKELNDKMDFMVSSLSNISSWVSENRMSTTTLRTIKH